MHTSYSIREEENTLMHIHTHTSIYYYTRIQLFGNALRTCVKNASIVRQLSLSFLRVVTICSRSENRVFHHVSLRILRKNRKSSCTIYEKSEIHHVSDCIRDSHALHRFEFLYLGSKRCSQNYAKSYTLIAEFHIVLFVLARKMVGNRLESNFD